MLYFGGVGLALFLCLLLLSKKQKTVADKILAAWLLVIGVHLLLFFFFKSNRYPQLLGFGIPFPLIHGPFLYLYTRAVTDRALSAKTAGLHVIPFLGTFIYIVPFLALPVEKRLYVFKHHGVGYETFNLIISIFIIASGIAYVTLSSMALRKHRASITDQFSNTEKISLQWLQYLIYWIAVIWLLVILDNDDLVFGAVVLFILFIGFFGIRQVGIFHSQPGNPPLRTLIENETWNKEILLEPMPEKPKYQKSGLTADASLLLHRELKQVMNNEKLFCNSELSLSELSNRLNTQPNHLSRVINEQEGKNFYDYINTLRIEEFKRVATSPESKKYTLLALAQHCGFNSKSSFNRYFKKVTGLSPSAFMQTTQDA